VTAIYASIVRDTVVLFELNAPSVDGMRHRIVSTEMPWLVGLDELGIFCGYVYAGKHRAPAARVSSTRRGPLRQARA
jgi:L-amino acid N-acyltransferase YncA